MIVPREPSQQLQRALLDKGMLRALDEILQRRLIVELRYYCELSSRLLASGLQNRWPATTLH